MKSELDESMCSAAPSVFISHSHKDQALVEQMTPWLQSAGFQYWVSFEHLAESHQYAAISREIDNCDVFLLVWSVNSLQSHQVETEIIKAHSLKKIFAIYQVDNAVPGQGIDLLIGYKHLRVLPCGSTQEGFERLLQIMLVSCGVDQDSATERSSAIRSNIADDYANRLAAWANIFWRLKYDGKQRRIRELSFYDNELLASVGQELGIQDEDATIIRGRFNRDRLCYANFLRSALRSGRNPAAIELDLIDKKRAECCISLQESSEIISSIKPAGSLCGVIALPSASNKWMKSHGLISECEEAANSGNSSDARITSPVNRSASAAALSASSSIAAFSDQKLNGSNDLSKKASSAAGSSSSDLSDSESTVWGFIAIFLFLWMGPNALKFIGGFMLSVFKRGLGID